MNFMENLRKHQLSSVSTVVPIDYRCDNKKKNLEMGQNLGIIA